MSVAGLGGRMDYPEFTAALATAMRGEPGTAWLEIGSILAGLGDRTVLQDVRRYVAIARRLATARGKGEPGSK